MAVLVAATQHVAEVVKVVVMEVAKTHVMAADILVLVVVKILVEIAAKVQMNIKQMKNTLLNISSLLIALIVAPSCSNNNEPIEENPVYINSSDLYGTWIVKGNSPTMALITFKNSSTSYNNENYSGCYEIVEYTVSGTNYKFNGRYWGGYNYVGNGEIIIGKPISHYPTLDINSGLSYDDVVDVPMIYPSISIKELENKNMKLKIAGKDFVGTINTEYTSSDQQGGVVQKEFANLGLSVNWAKCNIGAKKAEECGEYFGWGDPSGKKTSTNYDNYPCATDNIPNTIINTKYDIASLWGSSWRMPSFSEMQELAIGCISENLTYNGIEGVKYTGITGESIFLPNAGYREEGNIECVGHCSRYWSGDIYPYSYKFAWGMFSGHRGGWYEHRYIGCSVRAVKDK